MRACGRYGWPIFAALLVAVSASVSADYGSAREALERKKLRAGVAAMRAAAHGGDARAQNHLGTLYEDGRGVTRDFGRAAFWYQKAAEQGDPRGQLNLGRMYRGGMGIGRDERRAAAWYRAAAWQGVPEAQFFLGLMRESGRGVERDPAKAWMWFSLAADQGDEDAAFRRDRLAARLDQKERVKAREELRRYRATSAVREATRPFREPEATTVVQRPYRFRPRRRRRRAGRSFPRRRYAGILSSSGSRRRSSSSATCPASTTARPEAGHATRSAASRPSAAIVPAGGSTSGCLPGSTTRSRPGSRPSR